MFWFRRRLFMAWGWLALIVVPLSVLVVLFIALMSLSARADESASTVSGVVSTSAPVSSATSTPTVAPDSVSGESVPENNAPVFFDPWHPPTPLDGGVRLSWSGSWLHVAWMWPSESCYNGKSMTVQGGNGWVDDVSFVQPLSDCGTVVDVPGDKFACYGADSVMITVDGVDAPFSGPFYASIPSGNYDCTVYGFSPPVIASPDVSPLAVVP